MGMVITDILLLLGIPHHRRHLQEGIVPFRRRLLLLQETAPIILRRRVPVTHLVNALIILPESVRITPPEGIRITTPTTSPTVPFSRTLACPSTQQRYSGSYRRTR